MKSIFTGHGSPYDRGGADYYYWRTPAPHWYPEGTYKGKRIGEDEMTKEEIAQYWKGYHNAEKFGDRKNYE